MNRAIEKSTLKDLRTGYTLEGKYSNVVVVVDNITCVKTKFWRILKVISKIEIDVNL